MKKSVAILMALAMVLSLSASAFAVITPGITDDVDVDDYISGHNSYIGEYITGHNDAASFPGLSGERPRAALSNGGILICLMEDDSLYQYVHVHEIVNVEYNDIDTLNKEAADALKAAHDEAEKIEGKSLKHSYFFYVPETYTIDEDHYAKYLFSCPGENVEVSVNGNPVEVVSVNGRTSYIAKVTERGCITITVDK